MMTNSNQIQSDSGNIWSGFTGAFTWSNIGLQIGDGLISGGAGFVVGQLLTQLVSFGESMQDMMQRFADEIVGRLTAEMKSIVTEALYQSDLEHIKTSAASLAEKYSAYEVTGDAPLLDAALNQSFDAVESAVSLGIPALGTFATVAGLKMCLLEEKAKTNNTFHQLTLQEINRDSTIIDDYAVQLLAANEGAVSQFHSCHNVPGEGEFCIIIVNGVPMSVDVRDKQRDRQRLVDGLNNITNSEIITPARAIEATWKQFN